MNRKVCGVYRFIHIPSGKCYVGSSLNINRRINQHLNACRNGGSSYFNKKMKELGRDNFRFEIVEVCGLDIRFSREANFINYFNSLYPNGFNLQRDPSERWNFVWTKEMRLNNALRHKGNKYRLGLKHSPESRNKISRANKGNTTGFLGRKHSTETKRKISKSNKGLRHGCLGYRHTDEFKNSLSLRMKGNKFRLGIKHSKASRDKMSKAIRIGLA